jgi:chaperone modulatory protein CbpM
MLTVEQLQVRLGLDVGTLHLWIEEGWLLPRRNPDLAFSEGDVARAQLILDLKREMGVNDEGIGIILSLVDQMHGLRKVLRELLQSSRGDGMPQP